MTRMMRARTTLSDCGADPARRSCALSAILAFALVAAVSSRVEAVQIEDIVRLKGSETGKLVGMGIVVGLDGTGDGGDFGPAMRPLAQVIGRLIDPTVVAYELRDADNVALVSLVAELPDSGAREGDRVAVHVACVGAASSLRGGRLFMVPMVGPTPDAPVFAFAEGAVVLEDEEVATVGIIEDGAQLTRDVLTSNLDDLGRLQLVIHPDRASWSTANNIASLVNGLMSPDGPAVARAVDPRNVVVAVPEVERRDPAAFISQIMQSYIDASQVETAARVVINERTGTIVVSGDVEMDPVIISHKGLTITTILPPIPVTPDNPEIAVDNFVALDPDRRGGAKLADLLAAFNQLRVPAEDRIDIIKLIHKSGKLHAQMVTE